LEFALLIQGPFHRNALRNVLLNISHFDEFSFGVWLDDNENWTLLWKLLREAGFNTSIAYADEVSVQANQVQREQIASTLSALRVTQSQLVVKNRSDEFYSLANFLGLVRTNSAKVVCGNFPERPFSLKKFFVSDHLFGGSTHLLLRAFELLAENTDEVFSKEQTFESNLGYAIYLSHCRASNARPKRLSNLRFSDFRALFEICDIQNLMPFELNANSAGVRGVNDLRLLGRMTNPKGLPIDFVYRPRTWSYAPKSAPIESLLRALRFLMRSKHKEID
jgi:hypothetical protein